MAFVLLIEDDDDLRDTLKSALEETGYGVVDVAEGGAALRALEAEKPDLIVSDIVMDGMEGIAAIIEIRKQLGNIPIMTISGNELYLQSSEKLGASATLLKPFARADFLKAVANLVASPAQKLSTPT